MKIIITAGSAALWPGYSQIFGDQNADTKRHQPTLRVMDSMQELYIPDNLDNPALKKVVPAALLDWYRTAPAQEFKQELRREDFDQFSYPTSRSYRCLKALSVPANVQCVILQKSGMIYCWPATILRHPARQTPRFKQLPGTRSHGCYWRTFKRSVCSCDNQQGRNVWTRRSLRHAHPGRIHPHPIAV